MKQLIATLAFVLASHTAFAQGLTAAQKEEDFRYLASLYATYYAPMDWKNELFRFNARDLGPWLARVAGTTTDLDFYEVCVDFIASLNDTHVPFVLPSDFVAQLGFGVDIYDGVLLIDTINRTLLPTFSYPFAIGDELVAVDGVAVEQWLRDFGKYAPQGNPVSTRRQAAARITTRPQSRMPHASDVGTTATVRIRRMNGTLETYTMLWVKTGTPLRVGPVPSPRRMITPRAAVGPAVPDYMAALEEARFSGVLQSEDLGLLGYGARNPVFVNALALPALRFTRRLGGVASDLIYSGTFQYEELTIGYIRVPNYAPPLSTTWLQQLDQEIAFMQANTDGLIVDEMRNTGGNLCLGQELVRMLVPYPFQATGFALRPYWTRVLGFYNSLISARASNAPPDVIDQYEQAFNEMLAANREGRLVTRPLPLCSPTLTRTPATDASGKVSAYSKPLVMLIDEFSTSTADSVPSMIQDARRGLLYGKRTNGAGGNNTSFAGGPYSEASTGMTLAMQVRSKPIATPDYPFSNVIENVGVRPDVEADYMGKDNLLQNGLPFLETLLRRMALFTRTNR
ncbi:MAG: S41 family peptidase [Acidobacteriota bacterium]